MKRIFFITMFLLLCAGYSVSAQTHPLEIQVETSADKAFGEMQGDAIQITIRGDYPGYTIMLFDKEPWTGATPIKTIKDSAQNSASFTSLNAGVYHVCVLDAKENMDCKKVELIRR